MPMYDYINENLTRLLDEIGNLSASVSLPCPRLVAVTKSATVEEILALLATKKVEDVAENRVEPFLERREAILTAGYTPHFHLIGSLQTNKVKKIVPFPYLIQSLDRLSLALELEKQYAKQDEIAPVLIEVNSGREEAKGGVLPEKLMSLYEGIRTLPHLSIRGLMTMGPLGADEATYRQCFAETREAFLSMSASGAFDTPSPILSMGMSDSYRYAVLEGANMLRVGRALFKH